ncbi:MAG: signal peptidase I [Planctomyces sp.]|nr:signal peptidase I [Planctomyces sp.]
MTGMFGERATTEPAQQGGPVPGLVRQFVESLIVLAIAVLSFRELVAEGYLISTGSMAPFLLGYHRQVECPDCRLHFASGVQIDDDSRSAAQAQDLYGDDARRGLATCPNCGFNRIDIDEFPQNEGDQLMVHKHAYDLRDPRRWEAIVFRNPEDPLQPYVKRVVGLPGERVEIRDGDVWIDGQRPARSLSVLRGMRILVDDLAHQPERPASDWRPRWAPSGETSRWTVSRTGLNFAAAASATPDASVSGIADDPDYDWLTFRHWVRSGGRHVTRVALERWPADAGPRPIAGDAITCGLDDRTLSCTGVLSDVDRDRWLRKSSDEAFRRAILELAEASHEAPITDDYGYNPAHAPDAGYIVRDLLLELTAVPEAGAGRLAIEMDDGHTRMQVEFDFASGQVELRDAERNQPLQHASLPDGNAGEARLIETSLVDGEFLVAVDGAPLLPAVRFEGHPSYPVPRRPIRVGAADGPLRITSLRVHRDVYYTPKARTETPHQLAGDEFYVLGDNSPVSIDSRCWDRPGVRRGDLVGKPLIVHLPSQQAEFELFGKRRFVRIPDFSRVRYIR